MNKGGWVCPICERKAKKYPRRFNKGMLKCLIAIAEFDQKLTTDDPLRWIHFEKLLESDKLRDLRGNYSDLRYWGLVESLSRLEGIEKDGSNRGFWRMTAKGYAFLDNKIQIEEHVYIYNSKVVDRGKKMIWAKDVEDYFDWRRDVIGEDDE